MTTSRRSARNTVIGFLLMALVVLGGMAWATVATVELAKKDLKDAYRSRLSVAVEKMESFMIRVLADEKARPPSEYEAFHNPEQDSIFSAAGQPLPPALLQQKSSLCCAEPRHGWIDLYFQVDQDGHWTSPQVPEPEDRLFLAHWGKDCDPGRHEKALGWLAAGLPFEEFRQQVIRAIARSPERDFTSDTLDMSIRTQTMARGSRLANAPAQQQTNEYLRRDRRQKQVQLRSLASPQCLLPRDGVVGEYDVAVDSDYADWSYPTTERSVAISEAPMATFWLEPRDGRGRKLACVRTGNEDGKTFYQGFICDWESLQRDLLDQIDDQSPFPGADLEPLPAGELPDPATLDTVMSTIPARLTVPGDAVPTWRHAWQSVRAGLIITWAAALIVLVGAGWGVRNLIALTDRRIQFAYAVTHELRTPLTTFRLYTDMLSAGLVPDDSKPEYIETLNREAGRLSGLVEDVLEYARLENHRVRLNPVTIDGATLIQSIAEDLHTRCAHAGVEAKTQNDVPDGQKLRTDVDLVRQIANVLVNNACRHARSSPTELHGRSEPATVLLHLAAENGTMHVDVIDSGPGIDRADARLIFKPFRRGRNADATAQGGIGLGLALVRNWAELLHGRLELISRRHPRYGGAHFRLSLPSQLNA